MYDLPFLWEWQLSEVVLFGKDKLSIFLQHLLTAYETNQEIHEQLHQPHPPHQENCSWAKKSMKGKRIERESVSKGKRIERESVSIVNFQDELSKALS